MKRRHPLRFPAVRAAHLAPLLLACGVCHSAPTTIRVSVDTPDVQRDQNSEAPAISADGRFVAWQSITKNAGPSHLADVVDVFIRDIALGITEKVSVSWSGGQADESSSLPSLSADGRYVAFVSWATNLVQNDTHPYVGIFVRDRKDGTTRRVSVSTAGQPAVGFCGYPAISADGRWVVFVSDASNLVDGDTNGKRDVFAHDRQTGVTRMMTVSPDGSPGNDHSGYGARPAVSSDGRYVAFESAATNLAEGDTNGQWDIYLRDTAVGTTERISIERSGAVSGWGCYWPAISGDGRFVAFDSRSAGLVPGDTNGLSDVFVRDRQAGTMSRVSLGIGGAQANRDVIFDDISADGRFIALRSNADNLIPGDSPYSYDVFVRDTAHGTLARVTVTPDGQAADAESYQAVLCAHGRYVAFVSWATNLIEGDTNGRVDVFRRGPLESAPTAPYTWDDVRGALAAQSGTAAPGPVMVAALDADLSGAVDLLDAVRIARKVAGLEANP